MPQTLKLVYASSAGYPIEIELEDIHYDDKLQVYGTDKFGIIRTFEKKRIVEMQWVNA